MKFLILLRVYSLFFLYLVKDILGGDRFITFSEDRIQNKIIFLASLPELAESITCKVCSWQVKWGNRKLKTVGSIILVFISVIIILFLQFAIRFKNVTCLYFYYL